MAAGEGVQDSFVAVVISEGRYNFLAAVVCYLVFDQEKSGPVMMDRFFGLLLDVHHVMDNTASKLQRWQGKLATNDGWFMFCQCGALVRPNLHMLTVIRLSSLVTKEIDKLRKNFLYTSSIEIN